MKFVWERDYLYGVRAELGKRGGKGGGGYKGFLAENSRKHSSSFCRDRKGAPAKVNLF